MYECVSWNVKQQIYLDNNKMNLPSLYWTQELLNYICIMQCDTYKACISVEQRTSFKKCNSKLNFTNILK